MCSSCSCVVIVVVVVAVVPVVVVGTVVSVVVVVPVVCYKIFYNRFTVIRLTLARVNDGVEYTVESPLSDHPKRKDQKHVWV